MPLPAAEMERSLQSVFGTAEYRPLDRERLLARRERVRSFLESRRTQQLIIAVIVVNAVTLGLETSPGGWSVTAVSCTRRTGRRCTSSSGSLLAKVYVYRARLVRDPWNIFDSVIVGISLVPHSGGLSVLRALRILRALRLTSVVPSLRRVVSALLSAMPGMTSIAVVVRAMEEDTAQEVSEVARAVGQAEQESTAALHAEITALRAEMRALRESREPAKAEPDEDAQMAR